MSVLNSLAVFLHQLRGTNYAFACVMIALAIMVCLNILGVLMARSHVHDLTSTINTLTRNTTPTNEPGRSWS